MLNQGIIILCVILGALAFVLVLVALLCWHVKMDNGLRLYQRVWQRMGPGRSSSEERRCLVRSEGRDNSFGAPASLSCQFSSLQPPDPLISSSSDFFGSCSIPGELPDAESKTRQERTTWSEGFDMKEHLTATFPASHSLKSPDITGTLKAPGFQAWKGLDCLTLDASPGFQNFSRATGEWNGACCSSGAITAVNEGKNKRKNADVLLGHRSQAREADGQRHLTALQRLQDDVCCTAEFHAASDVNVAVDRQQDSQDLNENTISGIAVLERCSSSVQVSRGNEQNASNKSSPQFSEVSATASSNYETMSSASSSSKSLDSFCSAQSITISVSRSVS